MKEAYIFIPTMVAILGYLYYDAFYKDEHRRKMSQEIVEIIYLTIIGLAWFVCLGLILTKE